MAPLLRHRAPPLALRRVARAVGRGVECAPAPTWPGGPKEGSRRPGASRFPGGQPTAGGRCAALQSAPPPRGALACCGGQPRPGAPRALEVVERVLTVPGQTPGQTLAKQAGL